MTRNNNVTMSSRLLLRYTKTFLSKILPTISWYSCYTIIYSENSKWIFNTIFVSSHMYPENPEGTQVIVGSMNMGYIFDTARNRTHNLFRPKREPIPLGHSDGLIWPPRIRLSFSGTRWDIQDKNQASICEVLVNIRPHPKLWGKYKRPDLRFHKFCCIEIFVTMCIITDLCFFDIDRLLGRM